MLGLYGDVATFHMLLMHELRMQIYGYRVYVMRTCICRAP
jgi:hypothetical protein